jgi:hypothetical protein
MLRKKDGRLNCCLSAEFCSDDDGRLDLDRSVIGSKVGERSPEVVISQPLAQNFVAKFGVSPKQNFSPRLEILTRHIF